MPVGSKKPVSRKYSRSVKTHKTKSASKQVRAQSVVEYLLTYSWALIIVALILGILIFALYVPSAIAPSTCSFVTGAYCQDMVFGSNSVSSSVGLFLTNTQPYPVLNPSITLNISSVGSLQGTCKPTFVAEGGAIICNVTIPQRAIAYGTLESGKLYLSAVPCPSGNAAACSTTPKQTYLGNFNSHVSPLLSSTSVVVSLSIVNYTQAANGVPDELIANVKMLGYPIAGATVTFKANQSFVAVKPTPATTDSSGDAVSYASSFQTGNVLINATFANVTSSAVIDFTPPIYVSFIPSSNICPSGTGTVLTVDGIAYQCSQLPSTFSWLVNSKHSYSFQSIVAGPTNIRYVFNSVKGCGATGQSGTIVASANCTISVNYTTQYFLSMVSNPSGAGTLSPGSEWL
ncbi:MAG: hypothetical protein QW719_03165, partial [Candidatus Micrarchaeaceae archaeon]